MFIRGIAGFRAKTSYQLLTVLWMWLYWNSRASWGGVRDTVFTYQKLYGVDSTTISTLFTASLRRLKPELLGCIIQGVYILCVLCSDHGEDVYILS